MEFTNDWFDPHIPTWNRIVPQYNPSRILEVGSYEGRSVCHVIELLGSQKSLEIVCVDTWGAAGSTRISIWGRSSGALMRT